MKFFHSFFSLFFLLLCFTFVICFPSQEYQDKINWLQNRLSKNFWRQDQNFTLFEKLAHLKGLYKSEIHINFVSKKNSYFSTLMRNRPVDDSNMFVTSFVLYSLFETSQLKTISLNDHQISIAIQALLNFRDKNSEYGIPQYIFWPQTEINGTWVAQPINLLQIANIMPNNPSFAFKKMLEILGLDFVLSLKSLLSAFSIPSDNDDSSVNLALLGIMKETNSNHFEYFNSFNFKKKQYYQKVLKYAYRPFSKNFSLNLEANEIDPRVYYIYHQFLQSKRKEALLNNKEPQIILPTTWLLNSEQQIKNKVKMPFSTNNVDSTVCANVLFGLCYQVVTNQFDLKELPELQVLIEDTSDLLVYSIQNTIQLRPDLTLIYYPSKYDFYWFVSRLIHLLKRYQNLPNSINSVKQKLLNVMKNKGTKNILENSHNSSQSEIYWVEFLGNYGGKQRNEDAIFSTALALNALLDTWTTRHKNQISFDADIPDQVTKSIDKAINFIMKNVSPKMKQQNSFFSGSWKSDETNPFIYPANIHHDSKGNNINPNNSTFDDISDALTYVMKGFIEQNDYKKMLSQKWFGYDTPTKFLGYNSNPFPYWSAPPITQVMLINVLSKYMRCKQHKNRKIMTE